MKKIAVLLSVAMLAMSTSGWGGPNVVPSDNTVTSAKIVDGAVATEDFANGAVTAAKIASSTITASQLANGAVTDAKIVSVNASKLFGQISTSRLRVGTTTGTVAAGNHSHVIGTSSIADGAVTDAKISGQISASKIQKASNIVTIAKSGGDFTSISEALSAINPTQADPYVIKLAPGTYTDNTNGGTEVFPITLKPFVSIIGSGMNNTKIYAPNTNAIEGDSTGVMIDGVTVESTPGTGMFLSTSTADSGTILKNSRFIHGSSVAYAAYVNNANSVTVSDCEFLGSEGLGVYSPNAVIRDSRFIQISGYSADNGLDVTTSGTVTLSNLVVRGFNISAFIASESNADVSISNIDADHNIVLHNVTTLIRDSKIGTNPYDPTSYMSLRLTGTAQAKVISTMLESGISNNDDATVKTFQCFDSNLDPVTFNY